MPGMIYGNKNAKRKLTADDVELIRQLHKEKKKEIDRINKTLSVEAIADKFGVSKRCIERAVAFETWNLPS